MQAEIGSSQRLRPRSSTDERSAAASSFEEGESVQSRLATMWREILKVDQVSLSDSFFELGGRSVNVMQLKARVRDRLQTEISISDVFRNPTLESLAELIEQSGTKTIHAPLSSLSEERYSDEQVLSFGEGLIWALSRSNPAYRAFNMQMGSYLEGDLKADALQQSIDALVCRHEVLRTTYAERDGAGVRVVTDALHVPVEVVDLRDVEEGKRQQRLIDHATQSANKPFELAAGPLMRVFLYRIAESRYVLNLIVHHIIADAWSFAVLGRELATFYESIQSGVPLSLQPPELRYSEFARWQRARASTQEFQKSFEYWTRSLGALNSIARLPPDIKESLVGDAGKSSLTFHIEEALATRLRELSISQGSTTFTGLLSVFMSTLSAVANKPDVAVVVPIAGRSLTATEQVVGLFSNSIVIGATCDQSLSRRAFQRQLDHICQQAYTHQEVPFSIVRSKLENAGDLVKVIFDYLDGPEYNLPLPEMNAKPFSAKAANPFDTDLIVFINDHGSGYRFSVLFDSNRFSSNLVSDFFNTFHSGLKELVEG